MRILLIHKAPERTKPQYEISEYESSEKLTIFINELNPSSEAKIVFDYVIEFWACGKSLEFWENKFRKEYGVLFSFILLRVPKKGDVVRHYFSESI